MPGSPSRADGSQRYNEVELPSAIEIKESSVSPGQAGAFSKSWIKRNTRFGPYKGEIIRPGQKTDIDYRYAWEIFEKKRNVLKYTISASDPNASNWMRNVNCARFYEEQNILSTQEGFSIFYVAMKDIKPGEELLTWFDPQLLKRTQRRMSRGERKRVGYTIELVPLSDEKKFVPEIIETKRARKRKVLGDDMLSFESDAALMQRSMNSMFRYPRKPEAPAQSKGDYLQPSYSVPAQRFPSPKKSVVKSPQPSPSPSQQRPMTMKTSIEINDNTQGFVKKMSLSQKSSPEKMISTLSIPPTEEVMGKKVMSIVSNRNASELISPKIVDRRKREAARKRRRRERMKVNKEGSVHKSMDRPVTDTRNGLDSTFDQIPGAASLLKPVIIRKKDDGSVEMEDYDETYNTFWSPTRVECDDLCPCLDKGALLKQENESSSSLHQASKSLAVQFTLLPEHQTLTDNNKVTYKCDICECSYNHAYSLKRHYLGIHINHQYISKSDAEFCQLETFYKEFEDEFTFESGNGKKSEGSVLIPTAGSELSTTNSNKSSSAENSKSVSANSLSLLCTEAALDSSADEGKIVVPTLASLAKIQCEKNKSFHSSSMVNGKHLEHFDESSQKSTLSSHVSGELRMCEAITKEEDDKMENGSCDVDGEISSTRSNGEFKASNKVEIKESCAISSENSSVVSGESETAPDIPQTVTANLSESSILPDASPQKETLDKKFNSMSECSSVKELFDTKKNEQKTANTCRDSSKDLSNVRANVTSICEAKEKRDVLIDTEDTFQNEVVEDMATENNCSLTEDQCKDTKDSELPLTEKTVKDTKESELPLTEKMDKGLTMPISEMKAESSMKNISAPYDVPSLQTRTLIQTSNTKTPQQFLLLVPLGTPASKISTIAKATPTSSFNMSQCQGNLPVVVFSSKVSTTTTGVSLQTSTLKQSHQSVPSISPSSSNIGQRFTLTPEKTKKLVNHNIQSTTIAAEKSHTAVLKLTSDTPTSELNPKPRSSIPSSTDVETQKSVKLEEADQPGDLYRCHMCVLVYRTMGELKHHIKNDPHRFKGGIKQYACPKCSVRFRNKANLARHTLMAHQTADDKDRKFKCSTCGKGFTTEVYLKMHARFHTGKSFPCKYGCVDALFPNAGSLVKHLRAVHPGLDLKEYIREKKRRERMKQRLDAGKLPIVKPPPSPASSHISAEYSMTNPGIGFQAKRGRPKGSKNVSKEIKEMPVSQNFASASAHAFEKEQKASFSHATGTENMTPLEIYPPVKKYYPIEKTWQKGNSFFKISTDERDQTLLPRRKFKCKLCNASFKSHLFLLKHRSKRHEAGQSVQEFLFEMAKDKGEENCPVPEETFQFSPPPSPKTFFSRVNERGAENMSKYIEGTGDMLKCRKKLSFDEIPDSLSPSPPKLEWTHFNFPPCFRYVRDNTTFYHNVSHNEIQPKVEKCEIVQEMETNADPVNSVNNEEKEKDEETHFDANLKIKEESEICEDGNDRNSHSTKNEEELSIPNYHLETKDVGEKMTKSDEDFVVNSGVKAEVDSLSRKCEESSPTLNEITAVDMEVNKGTNDSNLWPQHCKPESRFGDTNKGFKKSPRKGRAGMDEIMLRLNKPALKALNLEIGNWALHRSIYSNSDSILDSLNLFSKDSIGAPSQRHIRRRKRERFASVSACSQLLPSKFFCRSRDQLSCSIFSSPDVKDTKRYSMWQGSNHQKVDTDHSNKFCCPVVESVRQQEVSKKRKEIQERSNQEVIDIKPRDKMKEDFAASMGLVSRREYDRSYHVQEKTEHCIKPPEIWERYDRIWFGKKGTITVVCSICHRHFSCLELCLRHQLKKHPQIEPSSLEMERGNYVEDMYYYYPMPYGILAQTHLIPEKMPPPELYVCTRCRFPFKNLNKLYSHIVTCDPNSCVQVVKSQPAPTPVESNVPAPTVLPPVIERPIPTPISQPTHKPPEDDGSKPQRQRLLNSKYKSYQMFYQSAKSNPPVHTQTAASSETNKPVVRSPISSISTKSQNYINYISSFPGGKPKQHGLLYNPLNHARRREQVHVLDQHQCHGCNLKFNSMSMLERHVKKCDGKDKLQNQKPLLSGVTDEMMLRKQHTCRYCNKRFTFIKGVDLHYKRICSVRKIRKEENQLTEEDLAHEAELQRIIEHLNWSKSLNQDSSDIIQGRVKVEDDGTLTRIEKKRGRPYGKGKKIKKKGFKWTTLKYHRQDDEHSVPSGEQTSSVDSSLSNESLESGGSGESVDGTLQVGIKQEGKSVDELVAGPVSDVPKRKRGRPFKNGYCHSRRPLNWDPNQPKRKRGRPAKKDLDMEVPVHDIIKTELSLKDSIDFKRGELSKDSLIDIKREKPIPSSTEAINKTSDSQSRPVNTNQSSSKPSCAAPTTTPSTDVNVTMLEELRKRKLEVANKAESDTTTKPPARARGRPKKFDPSDMESSYKKKRKTDPGYVPFMKRTNSNESHTDTDFTEEQHDKPTDIDSVTSVKPSYNVRNDTEKLKENLVNSPKGKTNESTQKTLLCKEKNSPDDKKSIQPKTIKIIVEKSANAITKTITTDKKSEDVIVQTRSELELKTSEEINSEKQKSPNDLKSDVRKRKHPPTSSTEDPEEKLANRDPDLAQSPQAEKEASAEKDKKCLISAKSKQPDVTKSQSQCHGQTKGTTTVSVSASQAGQITVTMASTSVNGDVVQTPVAVRIVTLPIASLATTVPSSSPSSTPLQPLSPAAPVISSPLMKLTITPSSPRTQLATTPLSPVLVTSMASSSIPTTTNTTTATVKSPTIQIPNISTKDPNNKNKTILQSPTFPVGQIIPIPNQNVLVSPEVIHSGVTPSFIIHSSPRAAMPRQQRGPVPVSVPRQVTTTLTRHVSPSSVLLSTGKVVSLANPVIPGSSLICKTSQQGASNIVKQVSVINPIANPRPQQVLSSPPRPIVRKGTGIVVEPPKPIVQQVPVGSPPPSAATKPLYYVQTSPLSNQMVVPISGIKGCGVGASVGTNQVLLNLNESAKTNLNTIAVPQVQFIPVSLVQGQGQGVAQTLNQTQIISTPTTVSIGDVNNTPNTE